MVSSELWFGASPSFYNGVITSSCRFNGSTSKLVSPAFGSDLGNTWTWSAWVKFTNQTSDRRGSLFNPVGESASLYFDNTSQDFLSVNNDGSAVRSTSRLLRDPSSWYHIVLNGNGTLNKLWINGVLATFGTDPNVDGINIAVAHQIGGSQFGANYFFDGIMADINFVSETALDYTAFAEEKNGVLIPKEPSVTYGANGFRLQFKQTGSGADASGIGADTSGNNKHFTATNLNAYDVLPDSPENNFSTWNALFTGGEQSPDTIYTAPVLSNGNLEVSLGGNSYMGNNFRPTSGKWYAEIRLKTLGSTNGEVTWGWLVANTYVGNRTGNPPLADLFSANWLGYSSTGNILRLFDETSQLGSNITATVSAGNILQLALDIDNNKGFIGINNAWAYSGNLTGGDPANGTNPTFTFTDDEAQNLQWYVANGTSTDVYVANFGQDSTFGGAISAGGNADSNGIGDFAYAPPSGFLALCTSNLSDDNIPISPNADTQAVNHFGTLTYTGDGNSTQNIRSGATDIGGEIDFKPDFTWTKGRIVANSHLLYDSSRGAGASKGLKANDVAVEGENDNSTYGYLSSFETNGFNVVKGSTSDHSFMNQNNKTLVAWNWHANDGTTSSNTDGSITSTVQANTTAGFSIVTFTGNNTNDATIGHGLGTTPAMIITKNRDDSVHWRVWHKDLQSTYTFYLSSDLYSFAPSAHSNGYIKTVGSSTYSTYQANVDSNGVNGASDAMVAYCFAEVEGYSKFGSYTGNGNADGTFVFTGFRPAFLIVKRRDGSANNWVINDAIRTPNNEITGSSSTLYADTSNTESDLDTNVDFLSNGFKARTTGAHRNTSSTYIYMAFAEAPFKYANAR